MTHISVDDLLDAEREELKFAVESLGLYTDEEIIYVYNNLFRDEEGIVNYPLYGHKGSRFVKLTLY